MKTLKAIRFSRNWNNKLSCDIFTTIRPHRTDIIEGNDVEIILSGKKFFTAEVVLKATKPFGKIHKLTIMNDTGLSYEESLELFRRFTSSQSIEDLAQREVDVFLLKKVIKKRVEK